MTSGSHHRRVKKMKAASAKWARDPSGKNRNTTFMVRRIRPGEWRAWKSTMKTPSGTRITGAGSTADRAIEDLLEQNRRWHRKG